MQELPKVANNGVKGVMKRLDANKLPLNFNRTSLVIFHSPQKRLNGNIDVRFSKQNVCKTSSSKLLGLLLAENPCLNRHLN